MIHDSPSAQANILIVNNSPNELQLLSYFLQKQGYFVQQALKGKMALFCNCNQNICSNFT